MSCNDLMANGEKCSDDNLCDVCTGKLLSKLTASEELARAAREFLQANALTDDSEIARTYKQLADASEKYDKKEG